MFFFIIISLETKTPQNNKKFITEKHCTKHRNFNFHRNIDKSILKMKSI